MKILAVIFIILTFWGCKDKITGIETGGNSQKYPASLNNQWEYSNTLSTEFLDTAGNVDDTNYLEIPNTFVRIASISDSIPGYNNLIKMEIYNIDTPGLISEDWYSNDSVFSLIAYRNPGLSYPIIPKVRTKKLLTLHEFIELAKSMSLTFNISNISADSIQFYESPRIVLQYPLQIGSSWNELRVPFYRNRTVTGTTTLQINDKSYECYIIEAESHEYKIKMIDYVSLDAGLLKRELISDSLAVVTADSPDIVRYVNGHDVSILVNKNF